MGFPKWPKEACIACYNYFRNQTYKKHGFYLLGFSRKDYITFEAISYSKRRSRVVWFGNNLFFPLMVVFSPIIFTIIHHSFGTVSYNKSMLEIAIGGSLTLIGINVLRSSSTFISEKLDEGKIPEHLKTTWPEVSEEIRAMKSKLRMRVQFVSYLGLLIYFVQVTQLITTLTPDAYFYLAAILLVLIASIVLGRFIYLLETNFLDDSNVVEVLFKSLQTQTIDFQNMKDKLTKQGLIS